MLFFFASEQCQHITKMLDLHVKENSCYEYTGDVVVNKDYREISAIHNASASAPSIQLCQFNATKAFRTKVSHLAQSNEDNYKTNKTFNAMHALSASKFEDAHSEFTLLTSKDSTAYLEKNRPSIKNM